MHVLVIQENACGRDHDHDHGHVHDYVNANHENGHASDHANESDPIKFISARKTTIGTPNILFYLRDDDARP